MCPVKDYETTLTSIIEFPTKELFTCTSYKGVLLRPLNYSSSACTTLEVDCTEPTNTTI